MQNTLRFASKIHVIGVAEFERWPKGHLKRRKSYADFPWNADSMVSCKKQGYTDRAYGCNAGGFHNGEKLTLFHLIPDSGLKESPIHNENWPYSREKLEADIEKLSNGPAPLRGIICGGRTDYWSSPKLLRKLMGLFKKMNIPFSVIWGQPDWAELKSGRMIQPTTSLYGSPKLDTWLLHAEEVGEIKSKADLKKYYRKIRVDPGDELIIGGRPVFEKGELVAVEMP